MRYFSIFYMTKLKYSHIFNILDHVIKKKSTMKQKLKITSSFIIIASLLILGHQIYMYNIHIETLQQIEAFKIHEYDKEIFISILTFLIGITMYIRSRRIKE